MNEFIKLCLPLESCKSTEKGMEDTSIVISELMSPSQRIRCNQPIPVATSSSSRKHTKLSNINDYILHKTIKSCFWGRFLTCELLQQLECSQLEIIAKMGFVQNRALYHHLSEQIWNALQHDVTIVKCFMWHLKLHLSMCCTNKWRFGFTSTSSLKKIIYPFDV